MVITILFRDHSLQGLYELKMKEKLKLLRGEKGYDSNNQQSQIKLNSPGSLPHPSPS